MISALDQEEEKEEKMSRKLMGLVVAVFVVAGLSCPVLAGGNMYAMTVVSSSATVGPGGTFSMDVDLSSDASDVEIQGWSYGLCHDACSFATLDSVDSADTNTVNGGNAADFDNLNLFACGFTQGVVISFPGLNVLAAGTTITMATGNYTATCTEGNTATFSLCDTLGSPPTVTVVVSGGNSFTPTTSDASIECFVPPVSAFVRGDSNDSGDVNVADVIWLLYEMFIPGSPTTDCAAADDSNSDGSVDTADAVYTANYLFLGGPAPGTPHPDCGLADGQEPDDCGEGFCG